VRLFISERAAIGPALFGYMHPGLYFALAILELTENSRTGAVELKLTGAPPSRPGVATRRGSLEGASSGAWIGICRERRLEFFRPCRGRGWTSKGIRSRIAAPSARGLSR